VEDPALVLPRLAVKPRAWRESSIRPDVPDDRQILVVVATPEV